MERRTFVAVVVMAAVLLCATQAFATTEVSANAGFGAADIVQQSDKIKNFLFGPAMRVAGILGGAYGVLQAVLTSAVRPLLTFGGIGMAVGFMPKFIDSVFGSGMLLP